MPQFPYTRLRRNRKAEWCRKLLSENNLTVNDFILPLFVCDGENVETKIENFAGITRKSPDLILKDVERAINYGIKAVTLFPYIEQDLKDSVGSEALNEDNLICQVVKSIKEKFGNKIGVIADVALDCYTSHGHDGILDESGDVDNDETLESLCGQALALAKAGIDMVAPSDMMDGRVGAIRDVLDENGFTNVQILSHTAKFCSSFYGPFRNAVGSSKLLQGDKKTYQLSFNNVKESLMEADLDVEEGADILMVKPATLYLDVVKSIKERTDMPIFVYHISGEYSMLKSAAMSGILNYDQALIETFMSFKRAGATAIITYACFEIAEILRKHENIIC